MATVNFWADDVIAARDWYTELFGIEAYFQMPNTASIIDPFGNGLGIMYNFQYVQILNAQATQARRHMAMTRQFSNQPCALASPLAELAPATAMALVNGRAA